MPVRLPRKHQRLSLQTLLAALLQGEKGLLISHDVATTACKLYLVTLCRNSALTLRGQLNIMGKREESAVGTSVAHQRAN